MNAEAWIERLGLEPHPEGGLFREVYRSAESIRQEALPPRFDGPRVLSTAIYFLLRAGDISRWHRIRQDEVWHFYDGADLRLHRLTPEGEHVTVLLGKGQGALPMTVVPAGDYFGAEIAGEGFSLAGCTTAPGFEFADFELPSRDELLAQFPQHAAIIDRLG